VARGAWSSRREDTDIPRRAQTKAAEERAANQAAVGGETRRIDPPRAAPRPPTRKPSPARSRGRAKPVRGYGKTRR
jgi:hypothetical protein